MGCYAKKTYHGLVLRMATAADVGVDVWAASASVGEHTVPGFAAWQVTARDFVACMGQQGSEVIASSQCCSVTDDGSCWTTVVVVVVVVVLAVVVAVASVGSVLIAARN